MVDNIKNKYLVRSNIFRTDRRSNIFRTDREVTLPLLAQNSVGRCRWSRVFMQWCCSTCEHWV